MAAALERHYQEVARELAQGRVVPFLGAAVNLCGRPEGQQWQPGRYLPDGQELSKYIAGRFNYPMTDIQDLVRVSQYVALMTGSGPLYEELRAVFNADYPPTPIHRLIATMPKSLRDKGYPEQQQPGSQMLVVTTNYDDILERAFVEAGQEFDLVAYIADGEHRGKFWHRKPDGSRCLIERPNEYWGVTLDERPVILKIHGAIDRMNPEEDSFVITEDHYIDYLIRADISNLLPIKLSAELRKSHFLFLGYSLRDWNLRVILHRIWGQQKRNYNSWAIQIEPQLIDQKFWAKRDVEILNVGLDEYAEKLSVHLGQLPQVVAV